MRRKKYRIGVLNLFNIGDYIVHGRNGVCKIEDITHIDISGADKNQLYYTLSPMKNPGSKVFFPVDSTKIITRAVVSKEEAQKIVESIESIEPTWIENERQRELTYKEAMGSCDCVRWISIIKTLHLRNEERILQGKKITFVDDKYFKEAKDNLHEEFSIALGIDKEKVEDYILEHIK